MHPKYIALLLLISAGMACTKQNRYPDRADEVVKPPATITYNFSKMADSSQLALDKQFWSTEEAYYNQNNDGNKGFNYWWNAHALDVLVDGFLRTKNVSYVARMRQLVDGMYKKNGNKWLNNFYDDMEWMALACLRAYDATGDVTFKGTTDILWAAIKGGWTTVNGGGIMWEKNSPSSKNACSNAPAAILAARLYKLDGKEDDLNWAIRIYNWQKANLVEPARGVVWDGYGNKNEANIYTYNQGTWLGSALELYTITKDVSYLKDAIRNANYVMNDQARFSPGGVLKGENTGDGGLFKGIFIRYFTQLIIHGNLDVYTKQLYVQYLKTNGVTLLSKGTLSPDFIFHPNWNSKPVTNKLDASVQLSGVMLLEAIQLLVQLNIMA